MMPRRKFSKEFKLNVIGEIRNGRTVAELARQLEIDRGDVHRWVKEHRELGERAFSGIGRKRPAAGDDNRLADLERKIGQQTLEIDFLKRALQRVEEQRRLQALERGARYTSTSGSRRKKEDA